MLSVAGGGAGAAGSAPGDVSYLPLKMQGHFSKNLLLLIQSIFKKIQLSL